MAPITRSFGDAGASKARSVHRKNFEKTGHVRSSSEDAWEVVQQPTNTFENKQMALIDELNPLRDMADRVGREVDHFAETLDKFNVDLHGEEAYEAAYDLAVQYKNYSQSLVTKLKTRHEAQRLHDMRKEFGQRLPQSMALSTTSRMSRMSAHHDDDDGDLPHNSSVETLYQWQAEADTWELFRVMLGQRYRPQSRANGGQDADAAEQQQQATNGNSPGLWEQFVSEDGLAKERYLVLKWLQGAADHGEKDIEAISAGLEAGAGAGAGAGKSSGVWLNGWMETREKIKGAKRTQVPGTYGQLAVRRSDTSEPLVSTLDPDAPLREGRRLEKADAYSERSLWMTCWEMLRRGRPWSEVSKWCADRNQGWRAISLGASSADGSDVPLPGLYAGALWRRMCCALARRTDADEYEAAVYGLLSGDIDSVLKVSKSWDDHLYAYYNSLLLTQFDRFLLNRPSASGKATSALAGRFPLTDAIHHLGNESSASDIVSRLGQRCADSQQPLKLLQAALVANSLDAVCKDLALAINDAPWYRTTTQTAAAEDDLSVKPSNAMSRTGVAEDFDTLRVFVHMLIMLRDVHGPQSAPVVAEESLDVLLSAYIQLLRLTGKRSLTPLYASKMSSRSGTRCMAQVMTDIPDVQEKVELIRLMGIYHVDPIAVLVSQTHYLIEKSVPSQAVEHARFHILEETADEIYPGQRVKLDFPAEAVGGQGIADNLIVFYVIDGHWDITFDTLAYALRKLLLNGCFLEASYLVQRMPFETLSTAKSRPLLEHPINVFEHGEIKSTPHENAESVTIRLLQKQSRGYYELSILVRAIDALETWRRLEHEYTTQISRPSSIPQKLKRAFEAIAPAIEPALHGILLTAQTDAEAADLAAIRVRYLPELVLAYNSVLCAAAHIISRESLIQSMELAAVVADDSTGLGEAFVQAGRMRELVTALARAGEIMLKLNEVGKVRKEKKSRGGANLTLFEIAG